MSDLDATTPRVFLVRHGNEGFPIPSFSRLKVVTGETEWTISGRHTGRSDIPLTKFGETQVIATSSLLVGPGKLLDPRQVKKVWVSPRQRALRTFQLLFGGQRDLTTGGEGLVAGVSEEVFGGGSGSVIITEEIREWDYGDYEGLQAADVREMRKENGLDEEGVPWSVWRDGCEGGEFVDTLCIRYQIANAL